MVPVCDKRYHIYNRFRHFGAEIKKLWNYPFPCPLFSNPDNSPAVPFPPQKILLVRGGKKTEGELSLVAKMMGGELSGV